MISYHSASYSSRNKYTIEWKKEKGGESACAGLKLVNKKAAKKRYRKVETNAPKINRQESHEMSL